MDLPSGPTSFKLTSVKRYFAESIDPLDISDKNQLKKCTDDHDLLSNQSISTTNLPRRNPTRQRIVLASDLAIDLKPTNFTQSRLKEIEELMNNGVFEIFNK